MNENETTETIAVTETPVEFAPGTKVRVAADARTTDGGEVYFDGEIIGEVSLFHRGLGNYLVSGPIGGVTAEQFVAPKYLTEVIVMTKPVDLPEAFTQDQLLRAAIVQDLLDLTLSGNMFGGKELSWDGATAVIKLATYIETGIQA